MVKLRKHQTEVIKKVKAAIKAGKRFIIIDAPTGSGKSILSLELSKHFTSKEISSYILTHELSLMDQYSKDIKALGYDCPSVKGSDNYKCSVNGKPFSLGSCVETGTKKSSLPCYSSCEYIVAKNDAAASNSSLLNYAYWLLQMNYVNAEGKGPFGTRDIVISDEAHVIPAIVQTHFSPQIPFNFPQQVKKVTDDLRAANEKLPAVGMKWGELAKISGNLFKCKAKDLEGFKKYLIEYETALKEFNEKIAESKLYIARKFSKDVESTDSGEVDLSKVLVPVHLRDFIKLADTIKDMHCKIEDYNLIIEQAGINNMIVTRENHGINFKVLDEKWMLNKFFFPFAGTHIMMSATLGGKQNFLTRFGIDETECEWIECKTDWDFKKSPIIFAGKHSFEKENEMSAIQQSIADIDTVIAKHPGQRGIIHSNTYELSRFIKENSKFSHRIYIYNTSKEKSELIDGINELPSDSIIMGPSLTTGLDLKGDLARFSILVKVPFPSLSDNFWRKIIYSSNRWLYNYSTALTIEQAVGRTHRTHDDWATTYLIDNRFSKFLTGSRGKKFMKSDFLERIVAL